MKTFLFRLSMSLGVLLIIMSAIGHPAAVDAAPRATNTPKPTKTSRPTNTPRPTQTSLSTATPTWTSTMLPTLTFTPTFTEVPTDTPTNTPTDTPTNAPTDTPTNTPTDTPTLTPSITPCAPLNAAISPSGGDKISRTYTITGYDANGCTAPLQYSWACASDDVAGCANFVSQANVGTYGMPSGPLEILDYIQYTVQLDLCQISTTNCSTRFMTYIGVPPL